VTRRRFKPLVWPIALLTAGGLIAGAAEAAARSASTITLFGTLKVLSDLTLLIAVVWLIVAVIHILTVRPATPRA